MTVAESSPSRQIDTSRDAQYIQKTLHEAPPVGGILSLYNRGDRRRWYWPCPKCGEYFEGGFKMLTYDEAPGLSSMERADTVRMLCPHCSHKIRPDDRDEMNRWGVWVKDDQGVGRSGLRVGQGVRTMIASFWLKGVAASFVSWKKLLVMYFDALDTKNRTGEEEALVKFYNNDLAEPYIPASMADVRLPEVIQARAEALAERHVPAGVRFLVATIDVQKNMFVCQVFGVLPGLRFDLVLVDRFDVRNSKRLDDNDNSLWVKPASYVEDWDVLIGNVIDKEYPLDDGSGRMMSIARVGCDSGGKAGVTYNAYEFYRKLVGLNKHRRFILVKGDSAPNHPRARVSYPDSNDRKNKAAARGDIPVLMLNSNLVKDDLNGRLDCITPGAGMIRFPDWLSDSFFAELCVETRTPKGWMNTVRRSNEAWDLCYYAIGVCVSELIRVEGINWKKPPNWAAPWDTNSLVRAGDGPKPFAKGRDTAYDFGKFGEALG